MFEITMNGPGKNALGTAMMTFLLAKLDEAADRPVLLRGTGDAFSAGLDLKEVSQLDPTSADAFLRLLERCMSRLFQHPAPVVACVNGHAIAGGCVLTLAADHRVMQRSPRARIGLNEVALGIRFPPRVLSIVKHRVPLRHLSEVVLEGALFDGERALELGLIDELADDAEAVARAKLAKLATLPGEAYAMTKGDLRGKREHDLAPDDVLDRWMMESMRVWIADSFKQRIAAVLKK